MTGPGIGLEGWLIVACAFSLTCVVLLLVVLARRTPDPEPGLRLLAEQLGRQGQRQTEIAQALERVAPEGRAALAQALRELDRSLALQGAQEAERHARRLDALSSRLDHLRDSVDAQLDRLRIDNADRLEAMRRTVDDQLHEALERRLGESFRSVSERLEQVQRGLGEMQALAGDVGDLKRVLTNVKTRGTWGEAQLAAILEQLFAANQYDTNAEIVAGSGERVEFAIRLPGAAPADAPILLPIDAKFPREDYERLLLAQENADPAAAERAGRALEQRVRGEARKIADKYLRPPLTTDFAVLFVPVEGLFAELARRSGLIDELQSRHRVLLAGPTTIAAILSSLQMGLRTLAVERRSGEIRKLLVGVRSEFRSFGETLARTRDQLERAAGTIGQAEQRSRTLSRRLDEVELLEHASDREARSLAAGGDSGQAASTPSQSGTSNDPAG
ncbi:MAG: DNA recombination protein RmuC [Burkholderiaceae bacterium]